MVAFAVITTATTACVVEQPSPIQLPVVVDAAYDMTVDFSEYESFDVVAFEDFDDGPPPPAYDASNRRAIEDAIIDELSDRGLVFDDTDPDLRISSFVRLGQAQVVDERWWWDGYYGWYWGYASPWYDRDVVELDAGTLIIDVVDVGNPEHPDDDVLVFRGTATSLFYGDRGFPGSIPAVIDDIFDYWPSEEPT